MESRKQKAEGRVQEGLVGWRSHRGQAHGLLLTACCLLVTTGCVHRSLTIRSEPPGAELIVNGTRLGHTPYTYDFLWYNWYRITLTKDGYERLEDRTLLRAPTYLWIPFDLVMEILPYRIRDERELSYTLVPRTPLPQPSPPPAEPPRSTKSPSPSRAMPHDQAR